MKDRIKHGKNCATLTGLIRIELTEHIKPSMKTATDSFFDIKFLFATFHLREMNSLFK